MSALEGKDKFMALKKIKCIFVHGWGMNQAVWQPVIELLPEWLEPVAIDLPGHGSNHAMGYASLDELVEFCARQVNEPAYWVGWSLGGLVVTRLALDYPQKVQAMMLVASSPCFIQKEHWQHGMKAEVFDSFSENLENDYAGTIQRFLSLQVQGSESGRQILRQLRKKIMAMPAANLQALEKGLELLKTIDLRDQLDSLLMPVDWVLGKKDALVKSSLAEELVSRFDTDRVLLIEQAAHAPFLSHRDQFNQRLIRSIENSC